MPLTIIFLFQLDTELEAALKLVEAATVGNPSSVRQHLSSLVHTLTTLMPSPLASPRAAHTFVLLRQAAFEDMDRANLGTRVIIGVNILYSTEHDWAWPK